MYQPQFPEHDKLQKIEDQSHAICDFIEWIEKYRYLTICERIQPEEEFMRHSHDEGDWRPAMYNREQLLADFFQIDLKKLKEEKGLMLDKLSNAHIDL